MKRSLIVVPLVLLVLLNACGPGYLPQFSGEQWTAIAQTQQVMNLNDQDKILYWFSVTPNPEQPDELEMLQQAMVGQYQVTKVLISPLTSSTNVLQVVVLCSCPSGGLECYSPEEMLTAVLLKMIPHRYQIMAEVPNTVEQMWVVRNAEANVPQGMAADTGVSIDWENVRRFLLGDLTGDQFRFMVTPGAATLPPQ